MKHRFQFATVTGALAICLPCILAAAGVGGAAVTLGSWLGKSVVTGLTLFASGMVLFAYRLGRRRSCEAPR